MVPVLALEEVDSTNAEARRLAEAGESGPLWIIAARQSAGRGRRGRAWETGAGNLAATYLFTTSMPAIQAAQVSFVAALAVADLAAAYVPGVAISLKWPNDLMLAGVKAAGILVESGSYPDGRLWVAIGMGVNLACAPAASERPATSFAAHMRTPPPKPIEVLEVLSESLERWRTVWERSGFPVISEIWMGLAYGVGERCIARLSNETLEGIAEGLDADGAFKVRMADGQVRRITAGDVFF